MPAECSWREAWVHCGAAAGTRCESERAEGRSEREGDRGDTGIALVPQVDRVHGGSTCRRGTCFVLIAVEIEATLLHK